MILFDKYAPIEYILSRYLYRQIAQIHSSITTAISVIYKFTANTRTFSSKPTKADAAAISQNMETVTIDSTQGFLNDIEQGIS